MTLWMVRGDRHGRYQDLALEQGFVYHASEIGDLSQAESRDMILDLLREAYSDQNENRLKNWANQLYALAHRIEKGDLVVMPLRHTPQIAIGRVSGAYAYRTDLGGDIFHTVPVDWIVTDLPRTKIGQDLLYSLGAFMTVCQIKRNNAEARIKAILEEGKDPGFPMEQPEKLEESGGDEESNVFDVEQIARDQIMRRIERDFKGHDLARLVEAVLSAEGYVTELSSPGPDGGVDILAGQGFFGFSEPKLCVQVKSSQAPADVTILRTLQGTMQNFKADRGLLVSWGGFNKAVIKEARQSFFSVRLWDATDLIESVMRNYERLPEELQNELPLKRIWALVSEQE